MSDLMDRNAELEQSRTLAPSDQLQQAVGQIHQLCDALRAGNKADARKWLDEAELRLKLLLSRVLN